MVVVPDFEVYVNGILFVYIIFMKLIHIVAWIIIYSLSLLYNVIFCDINISQFVETVDRHLDNNAIPYF